MINFTKTIFAAAAALCVMSDVQAQNRRVDMEVSVTQPTSGTVVPANANFDFVINIKNNGPDDMVVGDTIFYISSISQNVEIATLTNAIASGATVSQSFALTNSNTTGTDQTANICFTVFNPNTDVTQGGNPVSVSYDDVDTSNNTDCAMNITLKSGSTSVEEAVVNNNGLVIYPNPATDKVGFNYTATSSSDVSIVVFDIMGREVMRHNFGAGLPGVEKAYELNINELNAGNYILSVINGDAKTMGRVQVK